MSAAVGCWGTTAAAWFVSGAGAHCSQHASLSSGTDLLSVMYRIFAASYTLCFT